MWRETQFWFLGVGIGTVQPLQFYVVRALRVCEVRGFKDDLIFVPALEDITAPRERRTQRHTNTARVIRGGYKASPVVKGSV